MVQCLWLGTFTAVAWVQSLVGELRSHEPCGMAKKKKKRKFSYAQSKSPLLKRKTGKFLETVKCSRFVTSIGKNFLLFVTTYFTLVIWCHKKYIIYKILYSSAPDGFIRPKNPITTKFNKYLLSNCTEHSRCKEKWVNPCPQKSS